MLTGVPFTMEPDPVLLKDINREQANLLLSTIYLRISRLNAEDARHLSFAQELLEYLPEIYRETSSTDEIAGRVFWDTDTSGFARTAGLGGRYLSKAACVAYEQSYEKLVEDYDSCVCPNVGTIMTYTRAQCYELFTMVLVYLSILNHRENEAIDKPLCRMNTFFVTAHEARMDAYKVRCLLAKDISDGTYGSKQYLVFKIDDEFSSLTDIHERLDVRYPSQQQTLAKGNSFSFERLGLHFPLSQIVAKSDGFYFDPSVPV